MNCTTLETAPQTAQRVSYVRPFANVSETPDGYLVEAELPGVGKDGVEVTLENDELTVVGRRAQGAAPGQLLYRESRTADFRRVFQLDKSIDAGRISAQLEHGVLRLQLPRAESVKPRKIEIAG